MKKLKATLKRNLKNYRFFIFLKKIITNFISSNDVASLQGQIQKGIESQWIYAVKNNTKLFDNINDAGFRCYSQFEEDGIILYLLSCVGKKTRTVVEICCGNGSECMAANLIINHGFKGYLFDGNEKNIRQAKGFFRSQKNCLLVQPTTKQAWITKSNVNELLENEGITGEVDVLSLDLDGNDYYIWQAIEIIKPRVCVFETHNIIPSDLSVTIPYKDDFYAMDKGVIDSEFRSVSLKAMVKLSKAKGYTLVGSHKHGFNVFFVRDDLLNNLLPRPEISDIDENEWTKRGRKERWPLVKNHPWVEV